MFKYVTILAASFLFVVQASAQDIIVPDGTKLFEFGNAGFDRDRVELPTHVEVNGNHKVYYAGLSGNRFEIGLATSSCR